MSRYSSEHGWRGAKEPQIPPGFEGFTYGGDHLPLITLICVDCGGVVATDFADIHKSVCPGAKASTT